MNCAALEHVPFSESPVSEAQPSLHPWHLHSRTLRSWDISACADTTDVSGSGGTGLSVTTRGSRLRSVPGALCLDELPESQRSRTTAEEVARAFSEVRRATSADMFKVRPCYRIITFVQLVQACSEVRPGPLLMLQTPNNP